jgi:hypothetical protein
MIKNPENVSIGPIAYQIYFDDIVGEDEDKDNKIVDIEGCISHKSSTITVNVFLDNEYKRVVLMHEILHGMSVVNRIDLTEAQCDQLAYAFIEFMHDNPKLIDWMQTI